MKTTLRITFRLFLLLILFSASSPDRLWAETDSSKTYKFAVTDVVGLEELQREFAEFQKQLSQLSGVKVKLYPVTNRTAVVESIRSRRLDFALSGPSEYVVARKKGNVEPLVGLERPGYRSVIVVHKDSGIKTINDLRGKKIAFGDYGSTSYHLAPMQLLKDNGLDPTTDLKAVNVAKQVAWQSFVKKRVDAIGMGELRFHQYSEAEKGLDQSQLTVLATTPLLPGDVILAGAHVPQEIQMRIRTAFSQHGEALMNAILTGKRNQKYSGMKFISDVKDSDYDYIRLMYATAGYDEFAEPSNG